MRLVYQFKKKLIKEKRKKKNKKHGKEFGDRFKFLYSLGKQWHNPMQWDVKKTMQWWNLMYPKGWLYQMIGLLSHVIKE